MSLVGVLRGSRLRDPRGEGEVLFEGSGMLEFDLNDRKFITTGNEQGVSGGDTVFHYFSDSRVITGRYAGGRILEGQLIGRATSADTIEMRFQCITTDGELLSGASTGRISRNEEGYLELHFDWAWLTGEGTGGQSSHAETA